MIRDLSLGFKNLIKTEDPWHHFLDTVWLTRSIWMNPLLMLGSLALGIVFGLLATQVSSREVLAIAGGLFIFSVIFSRPEILLLLILVMSSTLVDSNTLPRISRLTPIELCVILLLGFITVRILSNRGKKVFVRTPLDWPIFLFFLTSTVSFFNAKYNLLTNANTSFVIWRLLFDYMIFFAVTNLVKTRRQLMTLVGGMFVMASIVAIFMIVQQAVGPGVSIIPGQKHVGVATGVGQEEIGGVARVSISGAAIVYMMLLPAFVLHITPEYLATRKWLSFIPVMLFPLAIAFTFDRNMWVGGTLGLIIFFLISRLKSIRMILLIAVLVMCIAGAVSLLNVYFPRINTVVDGLSARFESLFAGDELVNDSSTQWRLLENELAIPKILEYPILGVGPGGEYRRPIRRPIDTMTHYIHNSYLFILLDVGFVGFLLFMWFSFGYIIRGVFNWYMLKDHTLKSIIIGFTLSYIALLVSSTATPRFFELSFVPLIGVMLGINEVAVRLGRQSSQ